MKKTLSVLMTLLFCIPARAEEAAVLGIKAGKTLGVNAFLPQLATHPSAPLKIGVLPFVSPNLSLPAQFSEHLIQALSQAHEHLTWRTLSSPPQEDLNSQLNYNLQIQEIAAESGVDIILSTRVQKVLTGHWLLFSFYSGASGKILSSHKVVLKELNSSTLNSDIESALKDINLAPAVNDLEDPMGATLHLRTVPENMHVYLDDKLVGISPLILRQVPVNAHILKTFEQVPYQIRRIKMISDPPGVGIEINGKTVGSTPMEFPPELRAPGNFEVRFVSKTEYKAEIQIQTEPEGLPVQLNNALIKRTPVSFESLSDDTYQLKLLPYRPIEIKTPLQLSSGLTQVLEIDAYKYAKVIVQATENDADVILDGEQVGETPYSANIAQGQHQIKISKNRYREQQNTLVLEPGKIHKLFYKLEPRSADTSIFLTPTGEITPQLNIAAKYLGFGRRKKVPLDELNHLYGIEVDYGWPQVYQINETFSLGLEFSASFFALQSETLFRPLPGLGTKIQFLRESDEIPISAAIGSYLSFDPERPQWVGYLSLSRNFGDFALHLGIQTHGFSVNFGYTGIDNLRLGILVYNEAFLRLLSHDDENISSFYGLQAGYSF